MELAIKQNLKDLLINKSDIFDFLYENHEQINQEYFEGQLSMPLITIEKMNNKTLASYQIGENQLYLKNHIKFNIKFIELNDDEKIIQTLKHEMIHQWQDEILYEPNGNKKRSKCWHNKDFQQKAEEIGLPIPEPPAEMPKSSSAKKKKFRCGCTDDNTGKPLKISLAWNLDAVCNVCGQPFYELNKEGVNS